MKISLCKRLFHFLLGVLLTVLITSVCAVIYYKYYPVKVTPLMVYRSIQRYSRGESIRYYHDWIPKEKIPKNLEIAVITSEDQNFRHHHGFDFGAIKQAIDERKNGDRKRGASTISQQTAKNVFLLPQSSWIRKAIESYFTILIELLWSKDRIMEVYLNSIEMGTQIYGVAAVAQQNFGCKPNELTKSDCALIAATLPAPLRFSSFAPSKYMRKRQKQILKQMKFVEALEKQ